MPKANGERRSGGGGLRTRLLVLMASLFFCLTAAFATAWIISLRRAAHIDLLALSPTQRQELIAQFLEMSPSVLRDAWFEPRIGYTLRPSAELACWGARFQSNELGYRTGPARKPEGTVRIVFVGDSWTYGMGVSEPESFPAQFSLLANRIAGAAAPIEAWSLALPGYNATNELAALDAFFTRIQPDAVVLCPTINDIDSTIGVSPRGNMISRRQSEHGELFLYSNTRPVDSYLIRSRWEETFARYEEMRARLEGAGTPFFLFFVAYWDEAFVHSHIAAANVGAPYAILPHEYAEGRWRSTGRFGHGTPEAYGIFSRIAYSMVAPRMGWQPLSAPVQCADGSPVTVHESPPSGDWEAESTRILRERVVDAEDFVPGSMTSQAQCWSTVDGKTGSMSSNPAILTLRRRAGSSRLLLRLRPVPDAALLYPLEVRARIPSPSGGTRASLRMTRDAPGTQTLALEIPADVAPGAALDLIVETVRSVVVGENVARSLFLDGVEQE